jgi:tetratricopeptide (TPR) repeat protein
MISNDEDEELYNYNLKNKYIHICANEFYDKKDFNLAIVYYSNLIDNLVNQKILSIIYSNRSACYLNLKNYIDSLNDALSSVKFNIYNSKSWGRIGWSYKGLFRLDESIKAVRIANSLNPNNFNYKKELYDYNSKNISKLKLFNFFKNNKYILCKLQNENFRNKILQFNNLFNSDFIKDPEIFNFLDYIITKIN